MQDSPSPPTAALPDAVLPGTAMSGVTPAAVQRLRATVQPAWASIPVADRARIIGRARHQLAATVDVFVTQARNEQRRSDVDTVAAECLPLCEALKFLAADAARSLQTRRLGRRGRPLWLWGVHSHVQRAPYGVVLILGAWNYPLLLGGVQVAQALTAGNVVLWKPAPGSEQGCQLFAQCLWNAGVPPQALQVLASDVSTAESAIDAGVDLIVLTGSAATGRAVLQRAARTLTPAIMELSGCDAAIVLRSARLPRAAEAIRFGLTINSGATCIGPRRLLLDEPIADALLQTLTDQLKPLPAAVVHPAARRHVAEMIDDALQRGGRDLLNRWDAQAFSDTGTMYPMLIDGVAADWPIASADLFAPLATIQRVADSAQAVEICNACPYALAASLFAARSDADAIAGQLHVGTVTINDIIAPTGDPRLPFGGRRSSGFGVTRGREGLIQMTTPKVISAKQGSFAPHLDGEDAGTLDTLLGALQIQHAGQLSRRWAGLRQMFSGIRASRNDKQDDR